MKMHSYMATNGYLRYVSQQSVEILSQLRDATVRVGGWEKAIFDAKRRRDDLECETDTDTTNTGTSASPFGTLELRGGALSTSYAEVPSAAVLRNRLIRVTEAGTTSETVSHDKSNNSHILVHHPDPQISALAAEYTELESELVSSGPERVRWPENITFKNFAVYQLIPTLVYELEYPRTKKYVLRLGNRMPRLITRSHREQNPSVVRFRKDRRNLWHLCSALHGHGNFHLAVYQSQPRTVVRSDIIGLGIAFYAGISSFVLYYIRYVRSHRCSAPCHLMECPECICNGFAELS
jgi:hypothetical protein